MWPAVDRASFFNPVVIMSYELQVYGLRVTSYELRVLSIRVTSYELWVSSLLVTSSKLRVTSMVFSEFCLYGIPYVFYYKFHTVYGIGLNSTESCGILYYGSDKWRVTSYELWVLRYSTSCEVQDTSYEVQGTSYEVWVTSRAGRNRR